MLTSKKFASYHSYLTYSGNCNNMVAEPTSSGGIPYPNAFQRCSSRVRMQLPTGMAHKVRGSLTPTELEDIFCS